LINPDVRNKLAGIQGWQNGRPPFKKFKTFGYRNKAEKRLSTTMLSRRWLHIIFKRNSITSWKSTQLLIRPTGTERRP